MDCEMLLVILTSLACLCSAIRVNPCRNKIAPYSRPNSKTLGLLFRPQSAPASSGPDCSPLTPTHPDDNPNLVTVDGANQQENTDYLDPVYSEEQTSNYQNDRPFLKPQRPQGVGGFWNWWPDLLPQQNWPTRPPRPPTRPPLQPPQQWPLPSNNWFWGWFGSGGQNKPPRPTKPPIYDGATKPVYEHIEGDQEHITWRPGGIVGGPNNNIIGVFQDLSNWSSPPTPRPTRPSIPGYNDRPRGDQEPGILGSFLDLLFKRK